MRLIAFLLGILWHSCVWAEVPRPADVARYLAGLPISAGPLQNLGVSAQSKDHAAKMQGAWSAFDRKQLAKLRAFAKAELPEKRPTALYFFSGPDFAYPEALFPDATTYVLAGLEPADTFPVADPAKLGPEILSRVQSSFQTFFDYGLFATVNMRGSRFAGVPELFAVQLALTGNTIDKVAFAVLDAQGQELAKSEASNAARGIRFDFHTKAGVAKRLYYFRVDLSDATVAASGFLRFCGSFGPSDVLLKNASFLLHKDTFSVARKFLLDNAASIVQDDSGIPFRFFDEKAWSLHLFGSYKPPPESFTQFAQPELIAFEKIHRPEPLDFPAGYYWWVRGSHLEVAINKSRMLPPVR